MLKSPIKNSITASLICLTICLLFTANTDIQAQDTKIAQDPIFKTSPKWTLSQKNRTTSLILNTDLKTPIPLSLNLARLKHSQISLYITSPTSLKYTTSPNPLTTTNHQVLDLKQGSANILKIDLTKPKPQITLNFKSHKMLITQIEQALHDKQKYFTLITPPNAKKITIKYLFKQGKIPTTPNNKIAQKSPDKNTQKSEEKSPNKSIRNVKTEKSLPKTTPKTQIPPTKTTDSKRVKTDPKQLKTEQNEPKQLKTTQNKVIIAAQNAMIQVFAYPDENDFAIKSTGFLITKDNFAITSLQFLLNSKKIKVLTNASPLLFEAKIYAINPVLNIALIKLKNKNSIPLPHLKFAPTPPEINQPIIALQGPHIPPAFLSQGKVIDTVIHRPKNATSSPKKSYIATNLTINQYNATTPVINPRGQIIGISQWRWEDNLLQLYKEQTLNVSHLKNLFAQKSPTPLTRRKIAALTKNADIPQTAIYTPHFFDQKISPTIIKTRSKLLKQNGLCPICHGTLKDKAEISIEDTNRQTKTKIKIIPCPKLTANQGYDLSRKFEIHAQKLIHTLLNIQQIKDLTALPTNKGKFKSHQKFLNEIKSAHKTALSQLTKFASINPDALELRLNSKFIQALEKDKLTIGSPVLLVLQSPKYIPINDEPNRFWSAYIPGTDIEILIQNPSIEYIQGADKIFVAGLLKALPYDPQLKTTPILHGAFIIPAEKEKQR